MKKVSKIILVIVLVLLVSSSGVGIAFGVISMNEIKNLKAQIEKQNTEDEKNKEDFENVLICGQYQILSTKNISDAYISGDSSKLNEEDKKTLEVASDVLKEIIDENMSDYEKEKAIYEWICENIGHDESGTVAVPDASASVDRPIGVLQSNKAVCVGYATTFRLLANMVNIDCMIMHDTSASHSWNLVRLDDNRWYIVDCYMDADNMAPLYSNFNMDSLEAQTTHDWQKGLYPEANGIQYNYMLNNLEKANDPIEALKIIKKCKEDGKNLAYIELKNDKKEVNMQTMMYITDGIYEREDDDYEYTSVDVNKRDDKVIVSYYHIVYDYEDYDEDVDPEYIDSIDYEKIDELLNDIFGPVVNHMDDELYKEYNEYIDDINM